MLTSKERAIIKVNAKIDTLKLETENMKKVLELLVDDETTEKCIASQERELETWCYILESIRLNKNENTLNF